MSGSHGNAVKESQGHDSHEAANDSHYGAVKRPKIANLDEKLEDIEHAFDEDIKKYEEHNTKDNHIDIQNLVGDSHDVAYQSIKKKFAELENDHHAPLAERGKEISNQHLNDLLESYITEFLVHNQGEHGKAKVEAYKHIKFDGENKENDRAAYIQRMFKQAGFNPENEKGVYRHMASRLKSNLNRHVSVVNDLAELVKKEVTNHHVTQNIKSTIGKLKYQQNPALTIKALNHFGRKIIGFDGYEIDHEDGKSKFYKHSVEDVIGMINEMHIDGKYNVDPEHLKEMGLKYKKPGAEHEGNHGGAAHH